MVVVEKNIYTYLGELLRFPKEDIRPLVDECLGILAKEQYSVEIVNELKNFRKDLEKLSLGSLQELYSYTFELVSDTTLDMGYYIHAGQDGFKRAKNLVTIKAMYRDKG